MTDDDAFGGDEQTNLSTWGSENEQETAPEETEPDTQPSPSPSPSSSTEPNSTSEDTHSIPRGPTPNPETQEDDEAHGPEQTRDSSTGETDPTPITPDHIQNQRNKRTETGDEDNTGSDPVAAESIEGINWENREIGAHYPVDAAYHCNVCNDFHADTLSEFRSHIINEEPVSWGEYLSKSGLHTCAGCGVGLPTLERVYCDDCTKSKDDRIPCRNCGEIRVKISDPFCSAGCAGERIQATDGAPAPLDPPKNPTRKWLDHPHRIETGIPSAAPFISNHELTCRECYAYGADKLHNFAVHVAEKHCDIGGWGAYIYQYDLRRCRVCDDSLHSLLPLYCGETCQKSDPNPVRRCANDTCDTPVERRQTYCSRDCYKTNSD